MLKHVFSCSYEMCSKILFRIFDIDISRLSYFCFQSTQSGLHTRNPTRIYRRIRTNVRISGRGAWKSPPIRKYGCHPGQKSQKRELVRAAGEKSRTRHIKQHSRPESWGEITDESLKSGSSSVQLGRNHGQDI